MLEDKAVQGAVVIERSFLAPAELVWRMWTEPDHFAAWFGPAGARVSVARMNVRVGGGRLVCVEMDTPDGPMRMWFAGEYREVVANKRLVLHRVHVRPRGQPDSLPTLSWASTTRSPRRGSSCPAVGPLR